MKPQETITTVISVVALLFIGFLGIFYRIYQDFIFKYVFDIRQTIDLTKLSGEMRVGRFGIFIGVWILLLIFNMAVCSVVFGKCDYVNQMKLTSILYMGIGATTFVLIGLIPSLVEMFENTFGLFVVSTPPMSWSYQYKEIMNAFKSKLFSRSNPNMSIPFHSVLPMFNIHTFEETFNAIDKESVRFAQNKDKPIETETSDVYDFWFDYSAMCQDENKDSINAKQYFKDTLFKLCFAKNNAGHFAWVYIATIVTILSVVAVK